MGSVEVYILGQKYTIKGDEPDEYLMELTKYVDDKIHEIYGQSSNMSPLKATILAAIDIADVLHKLMNEHELITRDIEAKTEALSNLLE